jgi:hypothetical protein
MVRYIFIPVLSRNHGYVLLQVHVKDYLLADTFVCCDLSFFILSST